VPCRNGCRGAAANSGRRPRSAGPIGPSNASR